MDQPKVFILGSGGLLGSELRKVFSGPNVYFTDKKELDVTRVSALIRLFASVKPKAVINAAAYTDVDGAQSNGRLAMHVNSDAASYVAQAAQLIGAFVAHISTDYVFDGRKEGGYTEDESPSNPCNIYGETKLLGEKNLQKVTNRFYLIRTSWLFGTHGPNFVETIIRLAEKEKEIKVVDDQHSKPTYAFDLAARIKEVVDKALKGGEKKMPFGVYHLVNEGVASRYEWAGEIVKQYGKQQGWHNERYSKIIPVSSSEFFHPSAVPFRSLQERRREASREGGPTPAKRPEWSALLNTKLPPMRPWQEALRDYLKERLIQKQ